VTLRSHTEVSRDVSPRPQAAGASPLPMPAGNIEAGDGGV